MWHKQGSGDYKLLRQHGTWICVMIRIIMCHSTNCSLSTGSERRQIENQKIGGRRWVLLQMSGRKRLLKGQVKEKKIKHASFIFKSHFQVVCFCVNKTPHLLGQSDQKTRMLKKCHKHKDAMFIWSQAKTVTQIRKEFPYLGFQLI